MYRRLLILLTLAGPLAVGLATASMRPASADTPPFTISGEVSVTKVSDGDSLRSGRLKIRLHGIDAPELKQTCKAADGGSWRCGEASRAALAAMTDRPLHCELRDVDRYGRLVRRCFAGTEDIAKNLVSRGLAMAYRRYSTDYVAAEEAAKAGGHGMWQGRFDPPWDWRKQN